MSSIQHVMTANESVLWEGKPQFLPFVLSGLPLLIFGLFFLGIPIFMAVTTGELSTVLLTPHFWIGIVIGPGSTLYALLVHRFVHYTITNKRTIIQKGLIGRDYVSVEHDQVSSTEVSVGILDKLFGKNSGSLSIFHAGGQTSKGRSRPTTLKSITDPYHVYQIFNKISHDVRSDIQYPNAMRPKNNPGYTSKYKDQP